MIIREPTLQDQSAFLAAMQRSRAFHHPWVNPPQSEEAFQSYIQRLERPNQKGFFICNDMGDIVGVFNISEIVFGQFQSAYLGFYVISHYTGQGYMNKGLKTVLEKVFKDIQLHRIEANIQPENTRSINLVKAHRFQKEGFSPRYLNIDGQWRDHERWALTYEDWLKKQ